MIFNEVRMFEKEGLDFLDMIVVVIVYERVEYVLGVLVFY